MSRYIRICLWCKEASFRSVSPRYRCDADGRSRADASMRGVPHPAIHRPANILVEVSVEVENRLHNPMFGYVYRFIS